MKVLGINGSPRKGGNTEILIRKVFEELEKEGIRDRVLSNLVAEKSRAVLPV